ncbi:hypothetical protein F5H01DRAFT_341858 [Linnemannia elongata]|nr:hypothetical protein F5H01DRAFT_341858 [Linnemannia elongata]
MGRLAVLLTFSVSFFLFLSFSFSSLPFLLFFISLPFLHHLQPSSPWLLTFHNHKTSTSKSKSKSHNKQPIVRPDRPIRRHFNRLQRRSFGVTKGRM